MNAVARYLRPTQKSGFEALNEKAKRLWAELDEIYDGVPIPPSRALKDALHRPDEVLVLRSMAELCDRELGDTILVTGELRESLTELKGECIGLALWIEGRL